MNKYQVNKVAFHLVSKDAVRLTTQEIILTDFEAEDQAAIQEFFGGHLKHMWNVAEARTTSSAQFDGKSKIYGYYDDLNKNPANFFSYSCEMAKLLREAALRTNASPGVLMVLWLTADDDERNFLALLKMEPARADRVALTESKGKELLKLAVRHIDQALPEPGDQILKWAVTPHPNRPSYQVKVRDEEGKELAQYFMNFLGCVPRLSEKQQIAKILEIIPEYTKQNHTDVNLAAVVPTVLDEFEQAPVITPDVVVEKIKESNQFKDFDEEKFREQLKEAQINDLAVSSTAWKATKLQYKLPSGIIIKGPRSVMENQVMVIEKKNEVEFRIRSPKNFEKNYAG